MRSKKLTNKKQKIFSNKQKGFRDGLSYSTPQKRNKGKCHYPALVVSIPKFNIFLMGSQVKQVEFTRVNTPGILESTN